MHKMYDFCWMPMVIDTMRGSRKIFKGGGVGWSEATPSPDLPDALSRSVHV